jgi:hypothetical protein
MKIRKNVMDKRKQMPTMSPVAGQQEGSRPVLPL